MSSTLRRPVSLLVASPVVGAAALSTAERCGISRRESELRFGRGAPQSSTKPSADLSSLTFDSKKAALARAVVAAAL
jgi:hypothetical protein